MSSKRIDEQPVPLGRRLAPAAVLAGASAALLVALDRADGTPATETAPTTVGSSEAAPDPGESTTTTPNGSVPTTSVPTTSVPTTSVPPSPTCTGTAAQGPTVSTRWGPVAVAAVVTSAGELCEVSATAPDDDRRSRSINARAVPQLNQRAVAAQGTDFDVVSGATVTTQGYKSSLQALLDEA